MGDVTAPQSRHYVHQPGSPSHPDWSHSLFLQQCVRLRSQQAQSWYEKHEDYTQVNI